MAGRILVSLLAAVLLPVQLAQAAPSTTRPAGKPAPAVKPSAKGELLTDKDGDAPKKFLPATKEESDRAIAYFKETATDVEKQMKVKFATLETAHFLIFTDWDAREYGFLKENVEAAYTCVSRQFEIPVKDNVFIGKLPVFMFTSHDVFKRYSRDIAKFDVPDNVLGYYTQFSNGFGRMSMWKPDVKKANGNVRQAEKEWANTLTHEFTHAFVARYRSNGMIPRWLNEGLAEVVAMRQFPIYPVYPVARDRARSIKSFQYLFSQETFLKGEDYPVAQTIVETLLVTNSKAFLAYFNDIKDGMEPEEALKKEFKHDTIELEQAWRKYISNMK